MNKKFLFIDRDGTLIKEPTDNYKIDCIEKLELQPNVISSLLKLQQIGFILIMISNQDYLGTEHFPEDNFYKPHNFLMKIFESQGINFDKVLICPHGPEDKCNCRKPKTALITSWLNIEEIDKNNSYVIGDRKSDMILANNLHINGLHYAQYKLTWTKIVTKLSKYNRSAEVNRITKETNVCIKLLIDNTHENYINTGINFFNHMLQQIAIHSGITMNIQVTGDLNIDDHHTVEDTALALGEALRKSLGNKRGIKRFGFILPMDESLAQCILDISGRPFLKYKAKYNYQKIGDLSTEMIEHFFLSLSQSMACTLHIKASGRNDHHLAESIFKTFGQTLRQAIQIQHDLILSSKGTL